MRRIAANLTILVVTGILFFAGAEIVLRMMGYYGSPTLDLSDEIMDVEDDVLSWRYIPNVMRVKGSVEYRINSIGFRDSEHDLAKPVGVTRIVVLGDSVTDGYEVRWEETFTNRLQRALPACDVMNVAQGGLNSPQEVRLLEADILPYEPDIVVLNFILNDCDFYSNTKGMRRFRGEKDSEIGLLGIKVDPRFKKALKSSAFIYYVKDRVENLVERMKGTDEGDYFQKLWANRANKRKVEDAFQRLAELADENGFTVYVLVWPLIVAFEEYAYGDIHDWVGETARRHGFLVIDLLEDFRPFEYRSLQVNAADFVHPNGRGHEISAARFLAEYAAAASR